MRLGALVLGILLASISVGAGADGLKITPGKWESTVTATNSMTGTTTNTSTSCMTEEEFDPQSLMEGAQGCQLVDSNLDNNTLAFSMACDIQGTQSTMQGLYSVDGDTGQGTINVEMDVSGQTVTMHGTFEARRIGDC